LFLSKQLPRTAGPSYVGRARGPPSGNLEYCASVERLHPNLVLPADATVQGRVTDQTNALGGVRFDGCPGRSHWLHLAHSPNSRRLADLKFFCVPSALFDRRFRRGHTLRQCVSHLDSTQASIARNSHMRDLLELLRSDEGQDIAEYAVMLAVILVLVVGTIRLVGSNANNVFSQVGSSLNQ